MKYTWHIPGIYHLYAHVGDIRGMSGIYLVFLELVYAWYIPGIYWNQPEGIYLVCTWYNTTVYTRYMFAEAFGYMPGIYPVYIRHFAPAAHVLARFVAQPLLAASDLDALRSR